MVPGKSRCPRSHQYLLLRRASQNRRTKWKKQNPGMDANSPTVAPSPPACVAGPLSSPASFMSSLSAAAAAHPGYSSAAFLYASQLPFLTSSSGSGSAAFSSAPFASSAAAAHSIMHHHLNHA